MPSEVEIGVWVDGVQKWVTGVTRRTSCHDLIKALLRAQSLPAQDSDVNEYVIVERWRKVERPLDHEQKILKLWKTWGEAIQEVRFTLRRIRSDENSDSETGSRFGRSRRRQKWRQGGSMTSKGHAPSSGVSVDKKPNEEDSKINDTMERLMRLVVAQGETIQTQLRRMQERDQQIENFEHQLHLFRVQSLGSDYLLQSYLKDPSQDHPQYREIAPFSKEEEKSNDSGVVTEEIHDSECRQLQNERVQHGSYSEELEDVRNHTIILDKLDKVLVNLLDHEESLSRLEDSLAKSTVSEVSKLQEEIASATAVHANTVASARQNEQKLRELDMVLYQRRMTLESLMKEDLKYEQEAIALQTHLDYIIHLPPTAFKLPEETLPKDQDSTNASKSTTPTSAKSILCESSSERIDAKVAAQNSTTAVPNLNVNDHKNLSVSFSVPKNTIKEETSSLKPLIKKESKPIKVESSHIIPVGKVESTQYRDACNAPQNKSSFLVKEIPPPLPATSPPPLDEEDDEDSAKAGSFCVSSRSSTSSDSSRGVMTSCGGATLKPVPKLSPNSSKDIDSTDSNSDTGLSSLHSSSDEGAYVLDTLV